MAFGDMLKVKNVREIKADFFTREFLDIPTHHELQLRHLGLEVHQLFREFFKHFLTSLLICTYHELQLRHLGLKVLQLGLCCLQLPTLALPALNLNGKNC